MIKRLIATISIILCILAACAAIVFLNGQAVHSVPEKTLGAYLHAPAIDDFARHDPSGTTILPEGKLLRPVGQSLPLVRWPSGVAVSPDESTLFVASRGAGQLIQRWKTGTPERVPFELSGTPVADDRMKPRRTDAGACAYCADGKFLFWSGGENGLVYEFDAATHALVAEISLNGESGWQRWADSYAMDLALSADGKVLYCADLTNFRVAAIDIATKAVVGSVRVGRYPYALAVAGARVYVANIGMFEYSAIAKPSDDKFDQRGLTFPAYGVPSKEAREGVDAEGRHVPGLGDPNAPEAFSVWGVDASSPAQLKVVQKIKTGYPVGYASTAGYTVGGSAPNFLLARGTDLYVSDNNNDLVERFDTQTGKMTMRTSLNPSPLVAGLRGVAPAGMALSPDGSRLYVAQCGLNALAVIDTRRKALVGEIATAWYPYRVVLSADGRKLATICFRGYGNGPNAGSQIPKSDYLGLKGAICIADVPQDSAFPQLTRDVLANNGLVDRKADLPKMASSVIPTTIGAMSPDIKYVVFITKENHSFDTIFDHVPGANDDPSLLRWGFHQKIAASGEPTIDDAAVMTNHNALAQQFTVSDNFYMEPEASGVGHRWLVGVMPNNWCQMTYTLGWRFQAQSTAPGRRASFGSNGSIAPEDYPEAGSMWEHLARHNVGFRNYGEGFEFAGVGEDEDERKTGAREVVNIPMPKVLFDNTCRDYPIFNMNIPDQYRAYWFEQDFTKLYLSGKQKMPSFVNIAICNDHGTGPNAKKGYPYVASWMADNDLALGRIVDFLSHTPYWKNMAIFVTQDDAGGEPDHVDAQRSVLLCISPWGRHKYVSHRHTTITSMHRTLYEIFGLPSLNLSDALANDFSDCFTATPDFTPYVYKPVDPRIFDPEKAKDPKDPNYKMAAREKSIAMDNDDTEEEVLRLGKPSTIRKSSTPAKRSRSDSR